VEPFRDLGSLSDADLKQLIDELTRQERIGHGRIDRLRAELQARLEGRTTRGKSVQRDPGE
jgi:chaperonin cofactor prefoldin